MYSHFSVNKQEKMFILITTFVLVEESSYDNISLFEFPSVDQADPDGLLAIGGDLHPHRLLSAYAQGIFPWFNPGEPILWWSPDPRFVLFPDQLHVSKSMRSLLKNDTFEVTVDTVFEQVIDACQQAKRPGQSGTWITSEMREAYCHLHKLGFAHSVETWRDGELVGGLYGVCTGSNFYGESMYAKVSNASKYAFIKLVQRLRQLNFEIVDCQIHTAHLESLGAQMVPRDHFIELITSGTNFDKWTGDWNKNESFNDL